MLISLLISAYSGNLELYTETRVNDSDMTLGRDAIEESVESRIRRAHFARPSDMLARSSMPEVRGLLDA